MAGVVAFRVIVLVLLDRRQADRLRGVAHGDEGKHRHGHGHRRRHIKRRVPVVEQAHADQEQRADQTATDVVRHVPQGHHATAFLLRPPVHHGPPARRPAHTLRPAIDEQQDEHDGHAGRRPMGKTEREHHRRRDHQAERQEVTRVGTVGNDAHQELGQAVGDGNRRQRHPQFSTGVALFDQIRHGQGEVFAQQVVTGVTDEDTGEDLPTQASVGAVYFFFRQGSLMRGRTKESKHSRAPNFLF
ncbi:hypothetical protein D3C76_839810 [compost metagenome]